MDDLRFPVVVRDEVVALERKRDAEPLALPAGHLGDQKVPGVAVEGGLVEEDLPRLERLCARFRPLWEQAGQ